ncbi:MAG: bZIP transcription factor [Thermoanaerobaculia bacterium]
MGLKEVLSKMKIVEITPEEAPFSSSPSRGASPPPPLGQPTDIRELLGTLQPPPEIDEKALAAASKPAEAAPEGEAGPGEIAGMDIPDFAAVYRAAGIQDPPHGYTANKVLEILSSPDLANLDSRAKAAALAGFLRMNPTGPVPITDVVQDAVRRDQALDRFEDFLRTKLKARTEEMEKENARLQAEIDELVRKNREAMDKNRRALEQEEARFSQWQLTKKAEERRLFEAVSPFVETNPITTRGAAAPPAPAPAAEVPETQA